MSARTAAELRDALEAVREALGIPHAATLRDDEVRAEVLQVRVMHALLMVDAILDDGHADPAWIVAYCRQQLAGHPATGYRTWDQAVAEQQAAKGAAA